MGVIWSGGGGGVLVSRSWVGHSVLLVPTVHNLTLPALGSYIITGAPTRLLGRLAARALRPRWAAMGESRRSDGGSTSTRLQFHSFPITIHFMALT